MQRPKHTAKNDHGLPEKDLCSVLNPWHTAKVPFFAVWCGLWHTAKLSCLSCVKALDTRQSACATVSCRHRFFFCRVSGYAHGKSFAVCYTWQSLCCVQTGLCRVFMAHGKLHVSRSVPPPPSPYGVAAVRNHDSFFRKKLKMGIIVILDLTVTTRSINTDLNPRRI